MIQSYLYLVMEMAIPDVPSPGEWDYRGHFKIGVSEDPKSRVKQLQTGNPYPLSLEYVQPVPPGVSPTAYETSIHERFQKFRLAGEWFIHHDDICTWFRANTLNDAPDEVLKMTLEQYYEKLGAKKGRDLIRNKIWDKFGLLLPELIANYEALISGQPIVKEPRKDAIKPEEPGVVIHWNP
jgi:hypothetical protein